VGVVERGGGDVRIRGKNAMAVRGIDAPGNVVMLSVEPSERPPFSFIILRSTGVASSMFTANHRALRLRL